MIGKQIRKIFRRLSVLSLSFVLVGGVCLRPFLINVKAGEITGTVGLLADTVTLWDVFNTISAGAGVIVANDLLQSASQENLDDILGKPIGYINSQGMIEYNDGTSPPEWDWSGLEQALQTSGSARAKIIEGVFGQNGGSGQGGDNNDPWYRKFINWVKSAVQNGKIKTSEILGNITPLTLDAISLMMGSYLGSMVDKGINVTVSDADLQMMGNYAYMTNINLLWKSNGNRWPLRYKLPHINHLKYFIDCKNGQENVIFPIIMIANNSNEDIVLNYVTFDATGAETAQTKTIRSHNISQLTPARVTSYKTTKNETLILGNFEYTNNTEDSARLWAQSNQTNIIYSPDVMTQTGPAAGGSWVPTPYYDGQGVGEFEIIPQEIVTNYTTYINNNNLTPQEIGEAFEESVNPYVQQEPLPSPAPTPAPEPVATPTTAPAYDPEAELGTAANPVTVAEPDYLPGVAAGEGQLPGISAVFPFSIPWDLKYILDMFTTDQDALAPHFEWTFNSTIFGNLGTIVIDLAQFDSAAAIARKLEFLLFALALAIGTKNLIWS